ncbi:PEP-CTERM sorting domain-containing protein [Oceanibacterium hippocampi]|uniref:Ice-binding protein C-terminal domain-containing protein n=1 Tax=Oceanibacterium hippocampi TaxID=745714 RepID=A0A1Y5U2P0_9PROT|nr:PEP-CTERM sorting domain-containing protein [Oceanibacterium hippocampi]SLN77143.1 hypothetical protein OCH7691_04304 [Oceanibacterium hippocampi]
MRRISRIVGGIALAVGIATGAQAGVIFSDNFDGVADGNEGRSRMSDLNWLGDDNWSIFDGTVDIVYNSDYSINCLGDDGNCVDLDGSTGKAGGLQTAALALAPGSYTLEFWLSGNQRTRSGDKVIVALGDLFSKEIEVEGNQSWTRYSFEITVTDATSASLRISGVGGDNIGALLDQVSLSTEVPEPPFLILFMLGIGLLVFAVRRRRIV